MPRQRPRVDLADPDDRRLVQVSMQVATRAPGGSDRRDLPHDETRYLGPRGLHVLAIHPVVPDVGIGHRDDLAGVGRIGEDFLVTAEGGVENDFAFGLPEPSKRKASEESAVFQGQDGPRSPWVDWRGGTGTHEPGTYHIAPSSTQRYHWGEER